MSTPPEAVFVTVGNAKQCFRRLLEGVDALAASGAIDGRCLFMQIGTTNYEPQYGAIARILDPLAFSKRVAMASIVICHGGAGTLIHVLATGKCPIVMPRRRQFLEHIDDHQVELTRALGSVGRVVPAWSKEDLATALAVVRDHKSAPHSTSSELVRHVSRAVKECLTTK